MTDEPVDRLLPDLPDHLRERTRVLNSMGQLSSHGAYILYPMRNAMRAHENPALDLAVWAGNRVGLPVLVYHQITERYPYASDRHHSFMLQGTRDVALECLRRGIGYALDVERDEHRTGSISELITRTPMVVVEEVPVEPLRSRNQSLAEEVSVPVVAVDTDCVVPMRLVGQLHDRISGYRRATKDLRISRIRRCWPRVEPEVEPFPSGGLPFPPVDVETMRIPDILARCSIDHSVGMVGGTVGGSRAGYRRWKNLREHGLLNDHRSPDTPEHPGGIHRLSPYLHYGMVSPFRIAREARQYQSEETSKFMDQWMIRRDCAHHFCFYEPDYDTVKALPSWARETLNEHEEDPRPHRYDWETLARAHTDDPFWNLCQRSLLVHGELPNHVRTTWTRRLLEWTPNLERALQWALELNDRYALDGRDPNTYLGIQMCFGAFDRPGDRERPIYGRLRHRDPSIHSREIDRERYRSLVMHPPVSSPPQVAVIGAGIAGAICARTLQDHNLSVDLFDKARGPGGRCSTRRAEDDRGRPVQFDHGAQYFTARGEPFRRYVSAWEQQGWVREWKPIVWVYEEGGLRIKDSDTTRYVAVPKMSRLPGSLLESLEPNFGSRVALLERSRDSWTLRGQRGDALGTYDSVVVSVPSAQAADLIEPTSDELANRIRGVSMQPVWAVMVTFESALALEFDALFVNQGSLTWAARNSSKPGRAGAESWVLHAHPTWSGEHIERSPDWVGDTLLEEFVAISDCGDVSTTYLQAHRWRYARAEESPAVGHLMDPRGPLVVCGDWLAGSRVEGAFRSGMSAAGRLISEFGTDQVRSAMGDLKQDGSRGSECDHDPGRRGECG